MKTIYKLFIACMALSLCVPLTAQTKPGSGSFGYFVAGVGMPIGNNVETRMKEAGMFGNNFSFNSPGIHLGGRWLGVYNRFMLGGGGYSTSLSGSNSVGEVDYTIGAGFFNFGHFITKKEKLNAYVFGGVGGGGANMRIKNTGPITMALAPNQQIPVNENRKINSGGFGFELGAGINRLITTHNDDKSIGGFMLGLVAGINFFPTQSWEFETNESKVTNMGNPSSIYVGITIGGGSLSKE